MDSRLVSSHRQPLARSHRHSMLLVIVHRHWSPHAAAHRRPLPFVSTRLQSSLAITRQQRTSSPRASSAGPPAGTVRLIKVAIAPACFVCRAHGLAAPPPPHPPLNVTFLLSSSSSSLSFFSLFLLILIFFFLFLFFFSLILILLPPLPPPTLSPSLSTFSFPPLLPLLPPLPPFPSLPPLPLLSAPRSLPRRRG